MTQTMLATAWAVLLPVALQAQSLGAVAKKAEEDRAKTKQEQPADDKKKAEKPQTKVYTNRDVGVVSPASVATVPAETGAVSSSSSPTSGGDAKDEASWRSRALELRRKLADDETKLAAARAHYNSLPPEAKGAIGAPVVEAWMKAKEEIARLTATVVNDQRALTDFEDEARRAGVLPGWIRER